MHTEVVPTCITGGRQRRMRHGLFPSTRGSATSTDGVYVVDMDEILQSQQTALQSRNLSQVLKLARWPPMQLNINVPIGWNVD